MFKHQGVIRAWIKTQGSEMRFSQEIYVGHSLNCGQLFLITALSPLSRHLIHGTPQLPSLSLSLSLSAIL